MQLYKVTDIEWSIKSNEIKNVSYDKYEHKYYISIKAHHHEIAINKDVFDLFSKKFPEHCINIDDRKVDYGDNGY